MTEEYPEPEFASLDAYITGQLALASAELARRTDTQTRLAAVLDTGQSPVPGIQPASVPAAADEPVGPRAEP